MSISFEWDLSKAAQNSKKHGISFETAITAFDDPFALRASDEKHSTESETREWQVGMSDGGVVVVVFTIRKRNGQEAYRIISARRANRRERALYEFNKRVPIS